jgi:hypothetical protein
METGIVAGRGRVQREMCRGGGDVQTMMGGRRVAGGF